MPEINITCKGSKYMSLDQLKNFQGNLKTLPESELDKLKRSILKHGFSFPVFIWNDSILDGHQRTFAVRNLIKEGYTIDPIPVVEIMAATKSEAAEKLLILNSHYAKITEDGLYEFLSANELDIHDIVGDLNLPDFDMDNFMSEYMETEEDPQGLTDEDEIPELPEEAITRPGDLICLGKNLLLCGDATHEVDVKRLMGNNRADMCFTSPPYNVGRTPNGKNGTVNESKYGRSSDNLEQEDYVSFLYSFITLALSFGDNVFCNIQSVAGN
ncbi:MAG: hypothetical protein KKD44_12045, partial [Proteobacteria bacterium]|nr:hypothetical protein [Pseudomonadota bacterium]